MSTLKLTAGTLLLMLFVGHTFAQVNKGTYTLVGNLTGFEEGTKFFLASLDNEREVHIAYLKRQNGNVIEQYIATDDLKAGVKSVDITGTDTDNRLIKLSDFKNKVVLLDFLGFVVRSVQKKQQRTFRTLPKIPVARIRNRQLFYRH